MRKITTLLVLLLLGVSTSLAQDTRFKVTIENVGTERPVLKKGIFNVPVNAFDPAPIGPGQMYEFSFTAGPGNYLSLATMFIQSNDLFYTFPGTGLALFDGEGNPVTGDVTDQIFLYDAGTEVNQEPGVGTDQAPRQSAPNTGTDENGNVARIEDGAMGAGGFSYPDVADVIGVSIAHDGGTEFTVTISNVSTENMLNTSAGSVSIPLSPGVWAVHSSAIQFFESGMPAPAGIEAIAEDGNVGVYDEALAPLTGVQVPLAPGAWAVHAPSVNFFESGAAASAGIEAIAEDGNPGILIDALAGVENVMSTGVFNTPVGADAPGPIGPGGSYSFYVDAAPGYGLSFATMFIQSNDLFYAPAGMGLPLFDGDNPISGDVTSSVLLWDAGTEIDEEPGVGPYQAPRQAGPDMGMDENGVIVEVDGKHNGYSYPANDEIIRVTVTPIEPVTFYARIENIGAADAVASADGNGQGVPFAPGVWAVHTTPDPLFTAGEADRGEGLEALAEDGAPGDLLAALETRDGVASAGVFNTPLGAEAPGPLPPGGAYEFSFTALPGDYLSFATMFVQSNDLFYAPDGTGVALFDSEGNARRANITHYVSLWDGGTEVNEEPGLGANQAPRQAGPDTGDDENGTVVIIEDGEMGPAGFTYPALAGQIRVTISQVQATPFRVLVENVSGSSSLASPLAPGAWAVHTAADPFFTADAADRGDGLEALAEDGDPGMLAGSSAMLSGVVSTGVFNTPIGADAPGVITPDHGYEFTVYAVPGDYLSLATMFVQSNDLFYGPDGTGIALFNDGTPIDGDVTDQFLLWDAGTEVNEEPGVGANQAPRQSGPNTGDDENGSVVLIADGTMDVGGFSYPNVADVIKVTINGGTGVAVEPIENEVPSGFVLHSNYPNPFNPTTTIRYELAQSGEVALSVYNVLGQKVTDLISGDLNAGVYEINWDGRDASGQTVASGVYLYRLTLNGRQSESRIMTLLK